MQFRETALAGAFIVDAEPYEDDRGLFARTFCKKEFSEHGLCPDFVQCNTSFNRRRGTLRGMHFQQPPYGETKLVRCVAGAIYDVMIDLRPESPTFRNWVGVELTSDNRRALYVPTDFAHGFQTLTSNAEVLYMMSETYHADHAAGVRWDDPAFGIEWPIADPILSERDASYPVLD
jgi:dTDP-4-dehydrorhamnose 3,5-epimerase